jgi:hypothetical protein
MPVKLRKNNKFFHFEIAGSGALCHAAFVRGDELTASIPKLTCFPSVDQLSPKGYRHGEEEEKGQEGFEEEGHVILRTAGSL